MTLCKVSYNARTMLAAVPLCTNQGCKSFVASSEIDSEFLYFTLKHNVPSLKALGSGATFAEVSKSQLEAYEIALPPLSEQHRIAAILTEQMAAVERARAAAEAQLELLPKLVESYLRQSLADRATHTIPLSECLTEISQGVGGTWGSYRVVGATREGIAPAKEKVGKNPGRYKLVEVGTIFYNPMRILLGSIAMIDEGEEPGITSPDYVVFKSKEGILHHRWFYYWLRSRYGETFIRSLARGAVRERMLFKRLVTANIALPSWEAQLKVSEKLGIMAQVRCNLEYQLTDIGSLPIGLLEKAFAGANN